SARAGEAEHVGVLRLAVRAVRARLQHELAPYGDPHRHVVGARGELGQERCERHGRTDDGRRADLRDGGEEIARRRDRGIDRAKKRPRRHRCERTLTEARVLAAEARGDPERARAVRGAVGVAAHVTVFAGLARGRLALHVRAAGRVLHAPLAQTVGLRRAAAGDVEAGVTRRGRHLALVGAREVAAGVAEALARAIAEVAAVALFLAVDRVVAARGAGARVVVALHACELALREAERRARRTAERGAVAYLALRDEAVPAERRGQRAGVAGVRLEDRVEH